jgi:mono/diheme cytochrome c family protein
MNVILIEHNKLWFAARERNWPLAAYELGEIREIMGDVQELVPTFKSLPLADMLDAVITKEIVTLEKAIEAKDFKAFAAGYDKFTAACNACHQGTENGFIVIKRPTQPAFTNQDYRPRN